MRFDIGTLWPWLVTLGGVVLLTVLVYLQGPRAALRNGIEGLGWIWVILMWAFPPMLLAIAFAFPELKESAVWPISDGALRALLLPMGLGFGWLIFQFLAAGNANTSYRTLQLDLMVSFFWALVFSGLVVREHALGQLQYWHLVPALVTVPEAFLNTIVAVNNVFQKNPTQMQKGE